MEEEAHFFANVLGGGGGGGRGVNIDAVNKHQAKKDTERSVVKICIDMEDT